MSFAIILNFVVQLLSYIFIALLILVSYWKLRKGTKEEEITMVSLSTTTLSAFITTALLLLMAGWIWDWLGFLSVLLGICLGLFLAIAPKFYLDEKHTAKVEGRRIGTVIWIISVVIGEFMLMWFSESTALQASFIFGLFLVLSMNTVYFSRLLKHKLHIKNAGKTL